MEKECLRGLTARNTKVSGKMANNMERVQLPKIKGVSKNLRKESGRMEKERNGLIKTDEY